MVQIKSFLKEIKNNKSLLDTAYITGGMFINSVFSYFLQLYLARNFTVADFGTYNALMSLFSILNVPAIVFSITLIKVVSELHSLKKEAKLAQLFWRLSLFTFIYSVALVGMLTLLRNILAAYMNIDNPWLYLFLGLYIMGGTLSVAPSGFFQGLQKFKTYALVVVNMGIIRLLIPVGLVMLGYKVGGVYFGLFLAMSLNYTIAAFIVSRYLKEPAKVDLRDEYKRILGISLPVLIMYLGTMTLNNIDVILVKKFFEAELAGYYSGAVILGKIILFGAGSFSLVMFPQITALKASGGDYFKKMRFFLALLIPTLLTAVAVYNIFPIFIARVFFGDQLINSAQYLPLFSIFISAYVLVTFLFMFFMAIDRHRLIGWILPAIVAQFVLINLYHGTLFTVMRINIYVTMSLLVILLFYLYKISRDAAR